MSDNSSIDALSGPLVRAAQLHKSYFPGGRELKVIRGLDLTVKRGEFLAVRGASGAGKSTLLHLIGALDVPTTGEVWLDGVNLAGLPPRALAEIRNLRIGFIFQAYHLLPDLDALENVSLPARIARVPGSKAEKKARELLGRVGLAERLHHKPRELSGGEQQRVAIARALINNPELLLADEPTGNLDSRTGNEILDLLCALRAEHETTLIIATHDAAIASRAPRIVEMADGVLIDAACGREH